MTRSPKSELARFQLFPQKALGQNFCGDPAVNGAVVQALAAPGGATVWEIGPGLGSLTTALLEAGARVRAFEIDQRLERPLAELSRRYPGFAVEWGDFLLADLAQLTTEQYFVCGNLPYYCGAAIAQRCLFLEPRPQRMVFVLQREVVEKAAAAPDTDNYGYLSVSLQLFATVRVGATFSPASFYPQPKVDSALVVIEPLPLDTAETRRRRIALDLASVMFRHRRKMALNLLKAAYPAAQPDWASRFAAIGLAPTIRGEAIAFADLLRLADGTVGTPQP